MEQQHFEQAVLRMVFSGGTERLTPSAVAYSLGLSVKDAEKGLDRMVAEGTLELDSDDDGNLFYFLNGASPKAQEASRGASAGAPPMYGAGPASAAPPGGAPWTAASPPNPWSDPSAHWNGPPPGAPPQGWNSAPPPSGWAPAPGAPPTYGAPPAGWPGAPGYGAPQPGAPGYGAPQPGAPAYGASQPGAPTWGQPGWSGAPNAPGPWQSAPGPHAAAGPWGAPPQPQNPGWGAAPQAPWGPNAPHGAPGWQGQPPGWQQPGYGQGQAWGAQPGQPGYYHQGALVPTSGLDAPKSPAAAAILSMFFPGAGQLYNGQVGKGLTFFFLFGLMATMAAPLAFIPWLFSSVDAYQTSRRINAAGLLPP